MWQIRCFCGPALSYLVEIQKMISQGDEGDKIKEALDEVFPKASSFSGI